MPKRGEGGGAKKKGTGSFSPRWPPGRLRPPSGAYFKALRERCLENAKKRPATTLPLLAGAASVLAFYLFVVAQVFLAPSVRGLKGSDLAKGTVLLAAGGEELSRLYEENRSRVPADSVAKPLKEALIATEDKRFYRHGGIDFSRAGAATLKTITAPGSREGGSTITMQLARNAYADVADDWPVTRKVKEWITAVRISDMYTKEEVLTLYLSMVPFNYNTFGVEAASQVYFGKPAAEIDTLQSAALVAMLKGPSQYNVKRNPEANRERRNEVVIPAMKERGYLTGPEARRLSEGKVRLDFTPVEKGHRFAPYFAELAAERLRAWAKENGYDVYSDGLRAYTTLSRPMQRAAKKATRKTTRRLGRVAGVSWSAPETPFFSTDAEEYASAHGRESAFSYFWRTEEGKRLEESLLRSTGRFEKLKGEAGLSSGEALARLREDRPFADSLRRAAEHLQGALVAIRPENGHIKAWVGGREFEKSPFDRASQAKRQPGSTFKPFVFAAALEAGYDPSDRLPDKKITYESPSGDREWSPGNFGPETGKKMSLREALAQSKNTITARLAIALGIGRVARVARSLGIKSDLKRSPALALGASELSLAEVTAAYVSLARLGVYRPPVAITRIENRNGRVVGRPSPDGEAPSGGRVSPETAYRTTRMMQATLTEGTGTPAKRYIRAAVSEGAPSREPSSGEPSSGETIRGEWAGKTGTTANGADGWFVLMHPRLVTGAWVGFDHPSLSFRTRYWGQGAHTALPLVGRFVSSFDFPPDRFPRPAEQGGRASRRLGGDRAGEKPAEAEKEAAGEEGRFSYE